MAPTEKDERRREEAVGRRGRLCSARRRRERVGRGWSSGSKPTRSGGVKPTWVVIIDCDECCFFGFWLDFSDTLFLILHVWHFILVSNPSIVCDFCQKLINFEISKNIRDTTSLFGYSRILSVNSLSLSLWLYRVPRPPLKLGSSF